MYIKIKLVSYKYKDNMHDKEENSNHATSLLPLVHMSLHTHTHMCGI